MIRSNRSARSQSKPRRLVPTLVQLETRELLSTTAILAPITGPLPTAHPMFTVAPLAVSNTPPPGAYTPAQVAQAYGFNQIAFGSVKGTGAGQTIAIVDAYDDPNIQADLNTFDTQFGLPSTTVTRVNENGGATLPATDSTGGWELEESLDVEWAHAIAPGAKIVLVEASSPNDNDLLAGVNYAAANANVVSMSWGGSEFSNESAYDSNFSAPGVAFVASSGDSGAPAAWPATSSNVISVGGTALTLGASNSWSSETGWSGSTGGPSAAESQPAYQKGVVTQTNMRANPDVAYDASPNTGFAVYDSFNYQGTSYGWSTIGGTSAGAPQWSALLAIADQGRALSNQPALNSSNPQAVLTTLYQNATSGDFHDVTTGASTGSPAYAAGPGYDYVTGLGSPVANRVVQSLVGTVTSPPAVDTFVISAPTTATAGASFNVTVTAENASGARDTGYSGTVHFTSSDSHAVLPSGNVTLTNGVGTFTVTLDTAGSQSVSVTDTTSGSSATASGIAVSPAAASQLVVTGAPTTATVGTPVTVNVTAKDPYGNVATGYAGTIGFSSTDPSAILPSGSVTLNAGTGTFPITFESTGVQSVTVSGAGGLSATLSGITVKAPAPTNLAAAVVSSSEIDLSWTASAGATGYTVQSSLNGTTWTTVGTTATGVTSFKDTGLSSGTTYEFRVQATGATTGSASAFSNTASATTTGTITSGSTTDTLWSNSYTPPENAYSAGSYDVGLKFTSSAGGTITGVRFYKQTWMGGVTHVGYLWSANGTLLAAAAFTNETSYGWEQVNFSNPVTISPNTVYIVSFSTGGGYFGVTTNYFSSSGYQNGPLDALQNSVAGGNGVYGMGNSSFPTISTGGMNFWADVVFSPSPSTPSVANSATSQATGLGASYTIVPPTSHSASSVITAGSSVGGRGAAQQESVALPVYRSAVAQAVTSDSARSGASSFKLIS